MTDLPICANSAVFGVSMTVASLGLAYRGTQAGRLDSKSLCDLTNGQKTNRRRGLQPSAQSPVFSAFADHSRPDTGNCSWADYSLLAYSGQPVPQPELLNPPNSAIYRL